MEHSRLVDLITRAQQGDKNALEELYVDIFNSVFRLALRMVKNPEDAEDITQEIYITVQEKISDLREPKAFYTWVNQITANKCNLILNKYKGIAKLDDEEEILALIDDDPANMPDKALDDEATRKLIMDVIDNLPDNQRVCIILFYYAQFTVVQIAETLETNENTIKTRLSIARAKIRKVLEELAENKGIKLWGIPLPLTPILREAIESMPVPDGLYARVMENIQSAQQMNSSDTLGQADPTFNAESIATNYETTATYYESITPNYETHAIEKETANMSNNYQPTNSNTVICPGCGSTLPPNIAVCFRCAKNLYEQTPPQNAPPSHAAYANPMSYATPVAATAAKSSATGIIIAVVATVAVFIGGIVGAHYAGWVDLPFLPERTGASTQDVTMQTPQEREPQVQEPQDNTPQEQASQIEYEDTINNETQNTNEQVSIEPSQGNTSSQFNIVFSVDGIILGETSIDTVRAKYSGRSDTHYGASDNALFVTSEAIDGASGFYIAQYQGASAVTHIFVSDSSLGWLILEKYRIGDNASTLLCDFTGLNDVTSLDAGDTEIMQESGRLITITKASDSDYQIHYQYYSQDKIRIVTFFIGNSIINEVLLYMPQL